MRNGGRGQGAGDRRQDYYSELKITYAPFLVKGKSIILTTGFCVLSPELYAALWTETGKYLHI